MVKKLTKHEKPAPGQRVMAYYHGDQSGEAYYGFPPAGCGDGSFFYASPWDTGNERDRWWLAPQNPQLSDIWHEIPIVPEWSLLPEYEETQDNG